MQIKERIQRTVNQSAFRLQLAAADTAAILTDRTGGSVITEHMGAIIFGVVVIGVILIFSQSAFKDTILPMIQNKILELFSIS